MKKRSGFSVMVSLIGLIKPLAGYMAAAITAGTAGHLCAAFITIFGGYAVLQDVYKRQGLGLACRLGRLVEYVPLARTRPSARGFGVDVGERTREREKADVIRFPPQVRGRTVLVWCYGKFSGPKRAKKSGKSPKKREILLTKTDTVPIL